MTQKEFSNIAHTIPVDPGIYKYFDEKNELIWAEKWDNATRFEGTLLTRVAYSYTW